MPHSLGPTSWLAPEAGDMLTDKAIELIRSLEAD